MDGSYVLKFDLLNTFALLPPPDSAVDHIFRNTVHNGIGENPVCMRSQEELEKYTRSLQGQGPP